MNRTQLRLAASLILPICAAIAAQAQTATPTVTSITFANAQAGGPYAASQNAVFNVTGVPAGFDPAAAMTYGLDYTLGALNCQVTGPTTDQCTVPVTFTPNLPGGHKDAVWLNSTVGGVTTHLADILVYGVGEAPLALVLPGLPTPGFVKDDTSGYVYTSVLDEAGNVYYVDNIAQAVTKVTPAGVSTVLPIPVTRFTGTQAAKDIAIDGAGTLYIGHNDYGNCIATYNTVTGVQSYVLVDAYGAGSNACGEYPFTEYLYSVAVDGQGNLYALDILSQGSGPFAGAILKVTPSGALTSTALSTTLLTVNPPDLLAMDNNADLFMNGANGPILELSAAGVQSAVNPNGDEEEGGLALDAAGSLYVGRYSATGISDSVAQLPAFDLATPQADMDQTAAPTGMSNFGNNGVYFVGDYTNLDKVDLTQGLIAFGEQSQPLGTASPVQTVSVYNGGNEPLHLSKLSVSGTGFVGLASTANPCTATTVLAPSEACNISAEAKLPHPGNFTGTYSVTSNSDNTAATVTKVALTAFNYGAYLSAVPSPVNFPNQGINVTSAPILVKVTNSGALYAASLGTATSSNPVFQVANGTCTGTLAVGAAPCDLSITFTPLALQAYAGVLSLPYTAEVGSGTLEIAVKGTGVADAPIVALTPAGGLNFPITIAGKQSGSLVATLKNTGSLTLTGIGASFGGTNPGDFVPVPTATTCGTSLGFAAGSNTCTFTVAFAPQPGATAARTATLVVTDSATSSPQSINLKGTESPATTATPVISPVSGSYVGSQTVSITDATAGATILYTVNGPVPSTTPGGSTIEYTGSFVVPAGAVNTNYTIRAIATAPLYKESNVAASAMVVKP